MHIQNAVGKVCGRLVIDIMLIIGSLAYMYILSAKLALMTLSLTPVLIFVIFAPLRNVKRKQYNVMRSFSDMESTYIDSLSGIEDIISFNTNHIFASLNRRKYKIYQGNAEQLGAVQTRLNFLTELTTSLILLIILVSGALYVVKGEIQIGQMIAAYTLLAYIIPAIGHSVDTSVAWQGARMATKRVLEIILQEREKKSVGEEFRMKRSLEIRNGCFGWTRTCLLFHNVTIAINKGSITALFGKSGSGKTTIVNLLQRKYKLSSGCVFIDGREAGTIKLGEYRQRISIVPQHVWVLSGTLLENIMIGRNLINPQAFSDFIKTYQLENFIERFQHGLFTVLGEEGHRLSGGEKQMLALTRALLIRPDILIIDEGFNAIDYDLFNFFFKTLKIFSRQSAILINTHNKETIKHADYIYILENGYTRLLQNPLQFQG